MNNSGFVADGPSDSHVCAECSRLKDAAPTMLFALQKVLDAYNQGPDPVAVRQAMDGAIDYVREAIDLATPRSSSAASEV